MLSSAALVLLLASDATPAAALTTAIRDQHGRPERLEAHRGAPVVVMVVTASRLRQLKGWELELRRRAPGLRFLRVADVPAQPPVSHEDVARRLRQRVPDEVSVLIDLERIWARAFRLDTREVNLLVFDAEGRLQRTFAGRRSPELLAEVGVAAEGSGAR